MTKRRRVRSVECGEFAVMLRRMIRAYARRVGDADVDDLAEMIKLAALFDEQVAEAIGRLRDHQEFSWRAVGEAAGITRQGAYQRWGRHASTT